MEAEETKLVREMVTLTKVVVEGMNKDHDLLIKTAITAESNKNSITENWNFTRKWVLKLGLAIVAIGTFAGVGAKIIKMI